MLKENKEPEQEERKWSNCRLLKTVTIILCYLHTPCYRKLLNFSSHTTGSKYIHLLSFFFSAGAGQVLWMSVSSWLRIGPRCCSTRAMIGGTGQEAHCASQSLQSEIGKARKRVITSWSTLTVDPGISANLVFFPFSFSDSLPEPGGMLAVPRLFIWPHGEPHHTE